jgi:glutamate synthase domain-containing protein 3
LQEHLELTASRRARDILADWSLTKTQFRLVRPKAAAAAIEAHNEGVEARL